MIAYPVPHRGLLSHLLWPVRHRAASLLVGGIILMHHLAADPPLANESALPRAFFWCRRPSVNTSPNTRIPFDHDI